MCQKEVVGNHGAHQNKRLHSVLTTIEFHALHLIEQNIPKKLSHSVAVGSACVYFSRMIGSCIMVSKRLRSTNSSKIAVGRLFFFARMYLLMYVRICFTKFVRTNLHFMPWRFCIKCWKRGRFHRDFFVVRACSATASKTQCSKSTALSGTWLASSNTGHRGLWHTFANLLL